MWRSCFVWRGQLQRQRPWVVGLQIGEIQLHEKVVATAVDSRIFTARIKLLGWHGRVELGQIGRSERDQSASLWQDLRPFPAAGEICHHLVSAEISARSETRHRYAGGRSGSVCRRYDGAGAGRPWRRWMAAPAKGESGRTLTNARIGVVGLRRRAREPEPSAFGGGPTVPFFLTVSSWPCRPSGLR